MLCKPLVSGFPAVLSSPGCSKQNRHTCLPKQYWFPAAAVRWNNLARTITILCPHFTPCICLHRYARAIAALNVRRHYLISSILSSKIHPLTPLLTSCSFHGLSSVAGDSLAEIIYQTGEGCFYHHSQHFCQFHEEKQDCSFKLHLSIMCQDWGFQRDAPPYHSSLESDLLQPPPPHEKVSLEAGE